MSVLAAVQYHINTRIRVFCIVYGRAMHIGMAEGDETIRKLKAAFSARQMWRELFSRENNFENSSLCPRREKIEVLRVTSTHISKQVFRENKTTRFSLCDFERGKHDNEKKFKRIQLFHTPQS